MIFVEFRWLLFIDLFNTFKKYINIYYNIKLLVLVISHYKYFNFKLILYIKLK